MNENYSQDHFSQTVHWGWVPIEGFFGKSSLRFKKCFVTLWHLVKGTSTQFSQGCFPIDFLQLKWWTRKLAYHFNLTNYWLTELWPAGLCHHHQCQACPHGCLNLNKRFMVENNHVEVVFQIQLKVFFINIRVGSLKQPHLEK